MRYCTAILFALAALGIAATSAHYTLSKDLHEKVDPLDWYPLAVGNKWIYTLNVKHGDVNKPSVDNFTREISVSQHLKIPEGLLVFRSSRLLSGNGPNPTPHPYLIRGNAVYRAMIDPKTKALNPGFKGTLLEGKQFPEFVFPLKVGVIWGSPMAEDLSKKTGQEIPPELRMLVDGRGSHGHPTGPMPAEAYSILFDSRNGPFERWFQKGVGVLGEYNLNKGANYVESKMFLKKFVPAGKEESEIPATKGEPAAK